MFGKKHVIDLDSPEQEKEFALQLRADAAALLHQYRNNPEILDRLLNLNAEHNPQPSNQPESPTPFNEVVDLYYRKLETQGRKGKQLAQRTLLHYKDKLKFWQTHFGYRPIHEIPLKELSEIQNWITKLPANYTKKRVSVDYAVTMAKNNSNHHPHISDKTRAEYLGQLKGIFEYASSSGFISTPIANHIEIPNTKHSKAIERLPFTADDLQKIFPGKDYGVNFGIHKAGVDSAAKFWFPLLAAFSGARLEELGQCKRPAFPCPFYRKGQYTAILQG